MKKTSLKKKLFGKYIEIVIYDMETKKAKKILKETYKEALRLQKIFNFYDRKSELSILNKKRKLIVSDELLKVIKDSIEFSKETNGNYDVALGKNILKRKRKKAEEKNSASYKNISIKENLVSLESPEVMIDLGSIAKGFITDKVAEFLKNKGAEEFLINSRGDLVFSGENSHVIGIENPRESDKNLLYIKLKNESVATSGDYKQFYGSFENSHILNQKDAALITVISENLEKADAFSTSLFVSEEDSRKKILKNNPNMKTLIVKKDLSMEMYNGFEGAIYSLK